MKMLGYKVEYVTEFAKDLTYAARFKCLTNQLYVTANQHYRMQICSNDVDYIVTDSPLLLGKVYADIYNVNSETYSNLVSELNDEFENFDFFVERYKDYQTFGRNQTKEEAIEIDKSIIELLNNPYVLKSDDKMKKKVKQIIKVISKDKL
jgi:hypothetical protein